MKIKSIMKFLVMFTAINLLGAIAWGEEAKVGAISSDRLSAMCSGDTGVLDKSLYELNEDGTIKKDDNGNPIRKTVK